MTHDEERRREFRERFDRAPIVDPAKPAPNKPNGTARPRAEVLELASTLKPETQSDGTSPWRAAATRTGTT